MAREAAVRRNIGVRDRTTTVVAYFTIVLGMHETKRTPSPKHIRSLDSRNSIANPCTNHRRTPTDPTLRHKPCHNMNRAQNMSPHDFKSLFLFSLLLSLSTRFLCIFTSNRSYRSFSSFAARLSFMRFMFFCNHIPHSPLAFNVGHIIAVLLPF